MIKPLSLFIALRYLRTKRKNRFASFVSFASVLGIGLGVAVLIVVASVMNGFEKEVTRNILGMTSHAMVFNPGDRINDWQTVVDSITRLPNVVGAAPFVRGGAMLNHRGNVRGVAVQGIDTKRELDVSELSTLMGDTAYKRLDSPANKILLGAHLAQALDVAVGNTVTLVAPRWHPDKGVELPKFYPLEVAGIFKLGMHEFDQGFAFVNIEDGAKVFELGAAVSGVRIRFNDPALAPAAAQDIANALGPQFAAINWTQYHRNFFLALKSQKRIMFIILSLIVAVAAFNIVASMVMLVKEKFRDIAILRTIGLSRRATMIIFMLQGTLIGVAGVVLGVVLGGACAQHAKTIVAKVEELIGIQFIKPDVYYIDYLPSDLRASDVAIIAIAAFLICVCATVYPAWQASRTAPAAALRYE